jgi:hypothetical protein
MNNAANRLVNASAAYALKNEGLGWLKQFQMILLTWSFNRNHLAYHGRIHETQRFRDLPKTGALISHLRQNATSL